MNCQYSLMIIPVYECVFDLLAAVQQRRVVIENNHDEKLSGILHETGSKQLVIVCHGFQSSKVIFFFFILSILFFPFYKNMFCTVCMSVLSKQNYWLIFLMFLHRVCTGTDTNGKPRRCSGERRNQCLPF
jgi:hypothetical protein